MLGENLLDHYIYDNLFFSTFLCPSKCDKEKENELAKPVLTSLFSYPFDFHLMYWT